MMVLPRLSVLMSVYKGEQYLSVCIESILGQSFSGFEFIIVDDGSTDRTWEILNSYTQRDSRIILMQNQPNQGVVRALNRGLAMAKGEYIARQDADDNSHPDRLKMQVEFLDSHPEYGLVAAVPQPIDRDGNPLDLPYWSATENEEIQLKLLDNMCLCGPTIMVRRECLEAAGYFFAEGLDASEDYDICLRLAEVTKLASIGGSLYLYRQHPESASKKREQMQAYHKAIALERAINRRYGNNPPRDKLAIVARDYLRSAVIGHARGDPLAARDSLVKALEVYPYLFDSDLPLEELVRAYTPLAAIDIALQYTASIFDDLLPKSQLLKRMKSRLLSDLHMSQVFAGMISNQPERINTHLWFAIRDNPSWLLNRGVISILVKNLFRLNSQR